MTVILFIAAFLLGAGFILLIAWALGAVPEPIEVEVDDRTPRIVRGDLHLLDEDVAR